MFRIYFLISILCFTLQYRSAAQISISDIQLISNKSEKENPNTRRAEWDLKKRSPLVKYNPVALILIGSMYVYQYIISPQFSRECIYHTSCSSFSKKSINKYGFIKGVFLSADRLMRCNPVVFPDISGDPSDNDGHLIDEPDKYSGDD